jgi:hypothetical protein
MIGQRNPWITCISTSCRHVDDLADFKIINLQIDRPFIQLTFLAYRIAS